MARAPARPERNHNAVNEFGRSTGPTWWRPALPKSDHSGVGRSAARLHPIIKEWQGYNNVKGFEEFAAEHRPDGWNVWRRMVTK
jgi:hypothetical protein